MSKSDISEKVSQFIFDKIDSVEQLEVLLFVRAHKDKSWTSEMIANELRSNVKSVSTRLISLEDLGHIYPDGIQKGFCKYKIGTDEFESTMNELAEDYKIRKQKILELIFSPLKKVRHFANAFMVTKDKKGDSNG